MTQKVHISRTANFHTCMDLRGGAGKIPFVHDIINEQHLTRFINLIAILVMTSGKTHDNLQHKHIEQEI